jgi:hypothetical protein
VLSAAAGLGLGVSVFLLGQPSANTSATIAQAAISFFTKSSFFIFYIKWLKTHAAQVLRLNRTAKANCSLSGLNCIILKPFVKQFFVFIIF